MARVPDASKATEYPLHIAGDNFGFRIDKVEEAVSKAGNDMLVVYLSPGSIGEGDTR